MSKPRKKKELPKRVLALPDLEQAKSAVLNTLTSGELETEQVSWRMELHHPPLYADSGLSACANSSASASQK
jgi:hypothetical protein